MSLAHQFNLVLNAIEDFNTTKLFLFYFVDIELE